MADEGTILNSNLFPVNANGDVLFLSVESLGSFGRELIPSSINPPPDDSESLPSAIFSKISVSSSPRNIEIIAGGASFAPSLWSFPAFAAGKSQ